MASRTPTGELNLATVSKMKVAEIKKELKARGLSTTGTKTELVERLQSSNTQTVQDLNSEDVNADVEMLDEDEVLGGVEEGGEEFDDDDDLTSDAVLADQPKVKEPAPTTLTTKRPATETTTQEVQPKKRVLVRPSSLLSGKENGEQQKNTNIEEKKEKPDESEKKVVKISTVTVKERLELRAQKFGTPLSEDAKKAARAARFGVTPSVQTKTTGIVTASTKVTFLGPGDEVLKKRAERFGGNVSSLALKVEENEKLKKRQERFGVAAATANNLDDKKKVRADRFKL